MKNCDLCFVNRMACLPPSGSQYTHLIHMACGTIRPMPKISCNVLHCDGCTKYDSYSHDFIKIKVRLK